MTSDVQTPIFGFAVRNAVVRECENAENPIGMSIRNGRTRIPADHARYMLALIDKLASKLAAVRKQLESQGHTLAAQHQSCIALREENERAESAVAAANTARKDQARQLREAGESFARLQSFLMEHAIEINRGGDIAQWAINALAAAKAEVVQNKAGWENCADLWRAEIVKREAAQAEADENARRLKNYEPVRLYNGKTIDEWKAEAEVLREALKTYGDHDARCAITDYKPCSCGYEAAIDAARKG